MAGLFDGEGCVSVIIRKKKGYEYHQLDMRINMTAYKVLEAVQSTYGGNLAELNRSSAKPHHKRQWQWYCQGKVALEILKRILPYSIEKREQIDLAVRFQTAHELGLPFDRDRVRRQLKWLKEDTSRVLTRP